MTEPKGLITVTFESCAPNVIGPGCIRRDLPSRAGVRAWVVEMEPGSEWPNVDEHDELGEDVFVLEGEVIEGSERVTAGTYLHFAPNSSHRPRTEIGVRMVGFNLIG